MFIKAKIRRAKFWLNLISAYFGRYRLRVAGLLILIVSLVFISSKIWPSIARSNVATFGYVGNYTIENIPASVLSLATQSLVTIDESGRPAPQLASHWTVTEDGKTYIVFLKDNLQWHNNVTVDARDITIAIDNVQITGLNNKAIEFKLQGPISSFPTILNKPVFRAKSFYGTGNFRIVDIEKVGEIIKKITLVPKSQGPRVEIRFYQSENQLAQAIKTAEVKYASVANASEFTKWPNLEVKKTVDYNQVVTIFFNNEDQLLSSKELRQALIYGINRSQFDGIPASSPISPKNWAYTTDTKKYEYNTGRAKELLAKSQIIKPQITLTVVPGLEDIAATASRYWQDLGIEVEIVKSSTLPVNFQALLAVNILSPDPDQYALWHSTQKTSNLTHHRDAKVDKLLEDGRTIQDEEKRLGVYQDFQKTLTENAPAAFLYHPYKYQVIYKNQKGIIAQILNQ